MGAFLSLACSVKLPLTLILGTVILALMYGTFWHDQPAKGQDHQRVKTERYEEV